MNKLMPKNREQAFAFQIADDVKLLLRLSTIQKEDNSAYKKQIERIKTMINLYENP